MADEDTNRTLETGRIIQRYSENSRRIASLDQRLKDIQETFEQVVEGLKRSPPGLPATLRSQESETSVQEVRKLITDRGRLPSERQNLEVCMERMRLSQFTTRIV